MKSTPYIYLIETTRIIIWYVILAIVIGSQLSSSQFIYYEAVFPLLVITTLAFLTNTLFLLWGGLERESHVGSVVVFIIEAVLLTSAIKLSGINHSLFLFMYLVNIVFCGFLNGPKWTLALATLTSVLFSYLMLYDLSLTGQNLFLALVFNNAAYFSLAFLSGYLGEQLVTIGFELRLRTRDLKRLQRINTLIVENMPAGLITTTLDGDIVHSNPMASLALGTEQKTLSNLFSLIPEIPKHISLIIQQNARLNTWKFDIGFAPSGGEKRIFAFVVSRFIDPIEQQDRLVFIVEDQTKLRKLEYAVRQNEKMAAIGQLAAGIAHEIRNPLASISGSIQMLKANAASDDDRKLMTIILRETDRLNGLISEFLEYSRPDQPIEDVLNLNELVTEVMEVIKMNKTLRGDVVQQISLVAQGNILGNREKLKQALLNIIINGYQAMTDAKAPQICVTTAENNGQIVLKIKDTGCGMDEALRKRIFEPFVTTKPKGTGLGLAVTHKILQNHGARIFVESEPGRGAEFTLEFPVSVKGVN